MKIQLSIIGFTSICLLIASRVRAEEPATRPAFDKPLVASANRFAVDYYKSPDRGKNNIVVAPFSIFTFLSILREGAKPEGASALDKTLGIDANLEARRRQMHELTELLMSRDEHADHPLTCSIASQLWLDKSAAPSDAFLAALRAGFDADVVYTDFAGNPSAAAWSINKWTREQTHGLLTDMLDDTLKSPKHAAMVNTIYFQASWLTPFDTSKTKDTDFHVTAGAAVKVPMMHVEGRMEFLHADGMQLVRLPYVENDPDRHLYEFVAIVPDENAGLAKLEKNLDANQLARWIASSIVTDQDINKWKARAPESGDDEAVKKWRNDFPLRTVSLSMPRFDISARQDVRGTLQHMPGGDPLAVTLSLPATGIADISEWEIVHGARIIVDETGTRAAAATAGGLFGNEPAPPSVFINIDHPFLYLIRETQTGAILFLGRVCDPSQK